MKIITLCLTFLFLFTGKSHSQSITNLWIKKPIPGFSMSAAYLIIKNDTPKDISLTSVSADFSKHLEIHTHLKEDGVMKMRKVEKVKIESNSTKEFKPGSYHIMLIGLKKSFHKMKAVKLNFHFSNGKSIEMSGPIKGLN